MPEGDSPLRDTWLTRQAAIDAYLDFEEFFGEGHALLARYAAFPLILTPELVNLIWINFADRQDVPWFAGPDFLLSRLCRPIGDGLYQVDPNAREVMLVDLVEQDEDGEQRLYRLADFLLAYVERQPSLSGRPELLRAYQWIAWSYLDPERVVTDMTGVLQASLASTDRTIRRESQADQYQVAAMLDLIRAPLEFSLPPERVRNLVETADFLVTYWYPGESTQATTAQPGSGRNDLLDRVASGLSREAKVTVDEQPDGKQTTAEIPEGSEVDVPYEIGMLEISIGPKEGDFEVITRLNNTEISRVLHPRQSILEWKSTGNPQSDGEWLFGWLISDRALSELARARIQGHFLQVYLQIDSDENELASIPWELLHGPRRSGMDGYLATQRETPFSRYIRSDRPVKPLISQLPLRLLVVVTSSGPTAQHTGYIWDGDVHLDFQLEINFIQEALLGLDIDVNILAEFPDSSGLIKELKKGYDIIHLLGEIEDLGSPYQAALMLKGDRNGRDILSGSELAEILIGLNYSPRLVFLDQPRVPPGTRFDVTTSLAVDLVRGGVPAVVTFKDQKQINFENMSRAAFIKTFYKHLLAGGPVDSAMNEARNNMFLANPGAANSPVLITSLQDRQLVVKIETMEGAEAAGDQQYPDVNDKFGDSLTTAPGDEPKHTIVVTLGDHPHDQPLELDQVYSLVFRIDYENQAGEEKPFDPKRYTDPLGSSIVEISLQLSSSDFKIWNSEPQTLRMRLAGKSRNTARFQIEPRHEGTGEITALFYRNNNFIQSLQITLQTGPGTGAALVEAVPAGRDLDSAFSLGPRDVSIFIRDTASGYEVTMVGAVQAQAVLPVKSPSLARRVAELRQAMLDVVFIEYDGEFVYQTGLEIPPEASAVALDKLARAGWLLFNELFGSSAGADARSIGDKLIGLIGIGPIRFQIISREFTLPWGALYVARKFDANKINPENFLGMKHIIEQIPFAPFMPVYNRSLASRPALSVSLNLNESIDEQFDVTVVQVQRKYWAALAETYSIKIAVRTISQEFIDALNDRDIPDQILYFFGHAVVNLENPGNSSLDFGDGRELTVDDLKVETDPDVIFPNRPLVIINASESAQMNPQFYDGFLPYFIGKGARGMIGTECKIPALFATDWARRFFDEFLLGEKDLGQVFLSLRLDLYFNHNNILGLLYSMYCDSDTIIEPLLVIT